MSRTFLTFSYLGTPFAIDKIFSGGYIRRKNGYKDTIILMIIILSSKILESVQSFTQNKDCSAVLLQVKYLKSLLESVQSFTQNKDSSAFLLQVKYLKSLLESIQSFNSSKYLKSLLESVQSFTSRSSQ